MNPKSRQGLASCLELLSTGSLTSSHQRKSQAGIVYCVETPVATRQLPLSTLSIHSLMWWKLSIRPIRHCSNHIPSQPGQTYLLVRVLFRSSHFFFGEFSMMRAPLFHTQKSLLIKFQFQAYALDLRPSWHSLELIATKKCGSDDSFFTHLSSPPHHGCLQPSACTDNTPKIQRYLLAKHPHWSPSAIRHPTHIDLTNTVSFVFNKLFPTSRKLV